MKSIVLIIPYFGKLPSYFCAWKKTAKNNSSIDFMFFTDIEELSSEENIIVNKMSFTKFSKLVQSKFDFEISLDTPYKCCDYKPAYGYIFSDYIKNYDFWGHCDIDLLFGDIRKFITDDILNNNDKILQHGHFILYRNIDTMNTLFMNNAKYPELQYKDVFSSPDIHAFDEYFGMTVIAKRLNIPRYSNNNLFFDINPEKYDFIDALHSDDKAKNIFIYNNKQLFNRKYNNDKYIDEELMYVHFQKRNISECNTINNTDNFILVPNKFILNEADLAFNVNNFKKKKYELLYLISNKKKNISKHISRYSRQRKQKQIKNFKEYIFQRKKMNKQFNDIYTYYNTLK